jgi:hypothetical protein
MAEDIIFEEWRTVVGFPDYAVSSLGRVKRVTPSRHKGSVDRILSLITGKDGRVNVGIVHKGAKIRVSILVCTAFYGSRPSPQHEVAHWDGDPTNNIKTNLRWATHKENGADTRRYGGMPRGSKHYISKLSEQQIPEIRNMLAAGISQQKIADHFGVSRTSIQCVKDGRSYGWLLS